MISKIFLLALLVAGTFAASSGALVTFKSLECEKLAMAEGSFIFGTDMEMYTGVGVMFIDMEVHDLHKVLSANSAFSECVATIEENQEVHLTDPPHIEAPADVDFDKWQLRRLSVRDLPLEGILDREPISETHVYVADTGIDCSHDELKAHCSPDADDHHSAASDLLCRCGFSEFKTGARCDCQSHGTHCAGLVAAHAAGWNNFVVLHAVKVLNRFGSGTMANVVNGIDWAAKRHAENYSNTPGIISLSLGGPGNRATDQAVERARAMGVLPIVAAGNENQDACNVSPARSTSAFTIGASDINDMRASFSNFGSCVNAFGPGVTINSSIPDNKMAYYSGTSMAAPVVVGITSYEAAQAGAVTPDEIMNAMLARATKDHIIDSKSPNANFIPYGGPAEDEFLN